MEEVLIFLGMAIVTYFSRVAMIILLGREMPALLKRWLRYVPVAVLAALIAPAALAPRGELEFGVQAWAAVVGAAVAWRTRNVLATIFAGMVTYWLLKAVGF